MSNENNDTARILKYLLKTKNMKQNRLAELLHVTPATVSKWVTGENLPNDYLSELAAIFDEPVDALLGRTSLKSEKDTIPKQQDIFEHLETFEIPYTDYVFDDIVKDNLEEEYQVWLYDLKYGQIKINMYGAP